jgi:hypothetical protein
MIWFLLPKMYLKSTLLHSLCLMDGRKNCKHVFRNTIYFYGVGAFDLLNIYAPKFSFNNLHLYINV